MSKLPKGRVLDFLFSFISERMTLADLDINGGSCYTVSKMACKILNKNGYRCHVKRVTYMLGDKIGKEMFMEQAEQGHFDYKPIVEAGGWTIGLGLPEDKRRDGQEGMHWVVYFYEDNEILDLTFGQAHRPDKNIHAQHFWEDTDNLPDSIFGVYVPENQKPPANLYINNHLKEWYKDTIKLGVQKLKQLEEEENGN